MQTKLTADTITDEQIRELLVSTSHDIRDLARRAMATIQALDPELPSVGALAMDRNYARARCAEILNARGVK